MSREYTIGTGFWSNAFEHEAKQEFFRHYWRNKMAGRNVIVVDNSELGLDALTPGHHIIRCTSNLGHVGDHLGQNEPHLCGWSMSWIIPALIAFGNRQDFFYVEQDVIAFGPWDEAIRSEAQEKGWLAAVGAGRHDMPCEQSLFWIRADAISRFIAAYMAITDSDGMMFPEHKFGMMRRADSRIGVHSLGVGRNRPLTPYAPAWYLQQPSMMELLLLQQKGLL